MNYTYIYIYIYILLVSLVHFVLIIHYGWCLWVRPLHALRELALESLAFFIYCPKHVHKDMEEICCANSFCKNYFTKAKPYLLTVALQFGFAGAYIFTVASFNHGMCRFVFIVYRNALAAMIGPRSFCIHLWEVHASYSATRLIINFTCILGLLIHDINWKLVLGFI